MVEWLEVAKAISELGILVVCAALVVVMFWLNYKRNNKKEDDKDTKLNELMDKVQKQNDMLVQQIVSGVVKHNLSDEQNSSLTKIEKEINQYLKEIQMKTNASRVSLVRYHNGNKGLDGLSFLKMSMTNECVRMGIQPIMHEFQNYFRSFLPYWSQQLDETGICYIDDVEDVKDLDNSLYGYLKTRGVQSKYGIALRNMSDTVIGFICVEYLDKDCVNKDTVEECLRDKKLKIETLLNLHNAMNKE